jgi:Amt family ammonium transporter
MPTPANVEDIMPASLLTSSVNNATTPYVEIGHASTGFILVCSALVMLMTPGVGLLYSGLSRAKNALTLVMLSFLSYAVVSVQWVAFGFSLTFSETGSPFIGNFEMAGFSNVFTQSLPLTATAIPVIVFALYQMQFAAVTLAIIFGSVSERIRLLPSVIFMFFWTTLVYDPIAYWHWGARGWLKNLSCLNTLSLDQTPCLVGGLDFAGGGPVHMASGTAALAFCIFLGHRKRLAHDEFKPHNVTNVFLGTALLWFGWFGFNAGSALAATSRAGMAGFVTTVAASAGGLAWVFCDYLRIKKLSGVGFCSGAIAGLVGITPAAGFVSPWAAIIIGAVTGVCCCYAIRLKDILGYDDALDAFGLHGVGGFVGSVMTGIFTSKNLVYTLDAVSIDGGIIDGNWTLLGYNMAGAAAIVGYAFVVTLLILYVINSIPGLNFRPNEHDELIGGDLGEMGEIAYHMVHSDILPDMKEKELTVQ